MDETFPVSDAPALQRPAWARRAVVKRFLLFYTTSALILAASAYAILNIESNLELTALRIHESGQVEIASHLLAHDFEGVSSDLMLLDHAPSFARFLDEPTADRKNQVKDLFATLVNEKRQYDKVRYIDAKGREVVRVNFRSGQAVVAPEAELQDKSDRYFFQEAIRLSEGEVYVSPLDLNVDHHQIEMPYKPMVRFATPVFDSAHRKLGIVILNLYGAKLIDHLHLAIMDDAHAMLLNSQGDWLSGPDPEQEWGFMFNRPHEFSSRYPEAWTVISENEWGSFTTRSGLFTYTTVNPLLASQPPFSGGEAGTASRRRLLDSGYFWKIISHVPEEELPSASLSRHPAFLGFFAGGLALLAGLSGYLAFIQNSRLQLRQSVFDNERKLREIAQTLAEGVYVLDERGLITYINPEAKRLLGWAPQDSLLGQNAHTLFHHKRPDGSPMQENECPIICGIQSGQAYRSEEEAYWRKDGTLMPARVSASPILRDGRVVGSVVAFQDTTARKRAQEEIRRLAYYDTLTGLPNRRLLMDRVGHALVQARRYGRPLALMFLDLDHFKEINDTLGHDVGDALLKEVAGRLGAAVRSGDTVARQGGDEFVILLSEINAVEDAIQVADKLLAGLRDPVTLPGHVLQVSGSIGIAIYAAQGDARPDAQDLMKKADMAMYAAKQAGRNRYCLGMP